VSRTADAATDVVERIRRLEGTGMRTFAAEDPLVWSRTSGATVWDENGRSYVDLYAGFAVAAVGYCHPRVTEAITRQAGVMTHCPSAAPSRVRAELYERLIDIAPAGIDRALLAITGAMANETAIQLARSATGRHQVISFSGTYVGRTTGTVAHAGKRAYREQLGVRAESQFVPFPDPYRSPWASGGEPAELVLALLEELLSDPASGIDAPACIVVEPIQGNAGVVVPPAGFLAGLRRLADAAGALLVFDEIQCGFGRSGTVWACEHEGVLPDLMTVGKGIGGGLPLAAVLGREDVMTTWSADAVTSTFLANALPAAAASAAIDVLRDERLAERSAALGAGALERLRSGLAGNQRVGDVRGRGLFVGIELVRDPASREPDAGGTAAAIRALRDRGFIAGRGGRFGNVIKLSPPLVIDAGDLDNGIDAILEVLST
jgi:4-aminobutyrate aminotransferase-like enzyme